MQYMCIYVVSNICTVISISNKITISCHRVLSLYHKRHSSIKSNSKYVCDLVTMIVSDGNIYETHLKVSFHLILSLPSGSSVLLWNHVVSTKVIAIFFKVNDHRSNKNAVNINNEWSQKFPPPMSCLAPCLSSSLTVSNDPLKAEAQ